MSTLWRTSAELGVTRHIEDLLTSDHGQALLFHLHLNPTDDEAHIRAVRELAAFLARELLGSEPVLP